MKALEEKRSTRAINKNLAHLELEKTKILKAIEKASVVGVEGVTGGNTKGKGTELKYRGHFQLRNESARNTRGVSNVDQKDQPFYRFRTYFTFIPNARTEFNLTPQATKGFGQNNAAGTSTSGSNTHTEIAMFEANLNYKFDESLSAKLGKQELSYGDQLVIGSQPWDNTGRSFDALKANYKYINGWTDIIYARVNDNNTATKSTDDATMAAIYNSWSPNNYLKPIDLYAINFADRRANEIEFTLVGLRIKGEAGKVFYKTESGGEKGKNLTGDPFQTVNEIGVMLDKYKVSVEYGLAGDGYRVLYPTAHRFLGIADVLGRRNLEFTSLHFNAQFTQWLSLNIDQHFFKRLNDKKSAYKLNSADAWGTAGGSKEIGNELDFIMNIKSSDMVTLQLGAAFFNPGKYMKDQAQNTGSQTRFLYAQVLAEF